MAAAGRPRKTVNRIVEAQGIVQLRPGLGAITTRASPSAGACRPHPNGRLTVNRLSPGGEGNRCSAVRALTLPRR